MTKKYYLGLLSFFVFAGIVSALTTPTLLPTADGNYVSWTPSTGTTHYTLVDESTCNGTTDYNSTAVVGNRDSYRVSLSSIPNGSQITAVGITPCASRNSNGGGSSTMNVFYRTNGVNSSDSGSYSLTGTTPSNLAQTNFSGLSLIKTSSTTLESGAVYSFGTKGARLSRIATVLTYTTLSTTTVSASTVSSSQINLSWVDNNTFEDGYVLERSSTSSSGPFLHISTTSANAISFNDTGLNANTKYWYRMKTFNYGGEVAYSNTASSTTLANPPTVTTTGAIATTSYSALLKGSANPNGVSTNGWFRYATSSPGTCNDTFGVKAPVFNISLGSGTASVNYETMIYPFTPNTTYYYCAIAENTGGKGYGSVETFATTP